MDVARHDTVKIGGRRIRVGDKMWLLNHRGNTTHGKWLFRGYCVPESGDPWVVVYGPVEGRDLVPRERTMPLGMVKPVPRKRGSRAR